MTKKIAKKIPSKMPQPKKYEDLTVTMRLLNLVKQEVKSEITSLKLETKAGFLQMDSKLETLQSQMTKMMVILEEQNSRNKVALDGYSIVDEKLQESGERLRKIEKHMFGTL